MIEKLVKELDVKFAQHPFPSGPLITKAMADDHKNYITKQRSRILHIKKDGTGAWQSVYIPRMAALNRIRKIPGYDEDKEFDLSCHEDVYIIQRELPALVREYDRGPGQMDGETPEKWSERTSYFWKVERVAPSSFWNDTSASGVDVVYYHGARVRRGFGESEERV